MRIRQNQDTQDLPGVTTLVRRDKSLEELKGIVAELGSQGISSVEREMDGWVEANLGLDQEETAASLLAEHGEYIRIGLGQQEGSGVPYPPDPAYMAQICEPPAQTDTPSILPGSTRRSSMRATTNTSCGIDSLPPPSRPFWLRPCGR